jgi:polysaccharide biosynthesis protein PslH
VVKAPAVTEPATTVELADQDAPAQAKIPVDKRRLKILWLSHLVPYPPKGGAPQRSYYVLRHTARRHQVHLVAFNQPVLLRTPEAVREAVGHLSTFCASTTVFPIPSVASRNRQLLTAAISFVNRLPYEVNWLHSADMCAYLRKLANAESFDVLHVDTLGLMPHVTCFEGVPIVLTHHDVEWHLARRRGEAERSAWRRAYFLLEAAKIERVAEEWCCRAAVNVVVSDLDAVRLRPVVPNGRVVQVDNGVDVEYFRPGVSGCSERGGLVFAGSLNMYANRDAAAYLVGDIWPALASDNPSRRITIIGRNPPSEAIRAAQDPRVSVPGWVDDVRPYLDTALIYVCPIRTGGGTRLKVLDALAMGKPLVATALAVEGLELIEEEHYLRAEAVADYVTQIRRLENDSALRKRLAAAGREFVVRRYAWEVIGEKLDRAYRLAVRGA